MAPFTPNTDEASLRVLVTGFGPFGNIPVNPSWLAAKQLHGEILKTDPSLSGTGATQHILCSSLLVPVTYKAVLSTIPGVHARPPCLPDVRSDEETVSPSIPPPYDGYDLIFHVGVAGRGPLRLEKLGHKLGYRMRDADGELAPAVDDVEPTVSGALRVSEAEELERRRLEGSISQAPRPSSVQSQRGFGKTYEDFTEELHTGVDVNKLCQFLRASDPKYEKAYTSSDAGHYLCDFIYYCSLAEAMRTSGPPPPPYAPVPSNKRDTRVFFLHIPPENQPHSIAEVTEAIRRSIVWILSSR